MRPSPETDAKERESEKCDPKTHAHYGWKFARRLEGQRDELLEALEDYFRPHGSCKTGACTRCDFEDKARAAIRKVRECPRK